MESSVRNLEAARGFARSSGWLAETGADFADAFLAKSTLHTAAPGEAVYRMGDPADGLYGVVAGGFAFQVAPNEQGPHTVHLFRPGFWFGEAELFDGRAKIATISATRASRYLHVARPAIIELAGRCPDTWRWIGHLGGRHLELAIGVFDDATRRRPEPRLAAILLGLGGVRNHDAPLDPQPEIDVTQSDLAHLSTLARSSVVKHLDRLEAAGLIQRSYGRITLLDPPGLRDLLG